MTLHFLLQQAAWLYDRQLSKVRAQMRRAGTTHPHATSPPPWSGSGSSALGVQSITRNAPNPGELNESKGLPTLADISKEHVPLADLQCCKRIPTPSEVRATLNAPALSLQYML